MRYFSVVLTCGCVTGTLVSAFLPVSLKRQGKWKNSQLSLTPEDYENLHETPTSPFPSARTARIITPLNAVLSSILFSPSSAHAKSSKGSPDSGAFDRTISKYFPGAIPSTTVQLRVCSTLRKRQYYPYNTLLSTSFGSEEILNTPASLVSQLRNKLSEKDNGGVYNLGGLGGIPFAGRAGVYDLLNHAPANGNVIILYGPHVGIATDGTLGKVERIGKDVGSANDRADEASGAVVRAYRQLKNGKTEFESGGFNLELDYITSKLKEMAVVSPDISEEVAIAKITEGMFGIISDMLLKEVNAVISNDGKFWDRVSEVTLIGGVVINRGHGSGTDGGDDLFQPLTMKTFVKGGAEVNLYDEVFGDLGAPRRFV